MTTTAETSTLVRLDRRESVLTITINRPTQRNAVNHEVAVELAAAVDQLDADPQLSVGVLTGAGGTFSAGMDLKAFAQGELPVVAGRGFGGLTRTVVRKPLMAAVEGWALGGGFELVLACDLIVAAQDARFGFPEVTRGLVPSEGGLVRLPATRRWRCRPSRRSCARHRTSTTRTRSSARTSSRPACRPARTPRKARGHSSRNAHPYGTAADLTIGETPR